MIKLWSGYEPTWTLRADDYMSFPTMMHELFNEIKISETFDARTFEYYKLYRDHTELMIDIVEIFFSDLFLTPSQISKAGTSESYLFEVLTQIIKLIKYYELEEQQDRGHKKEREKYANALKLVRKYSDVEIAYDGFPKHKNEILRDMQLYFKAIDRVQQGNKVIQLIKKSFNIQSVNTTKRMKYQVKMKKDFEQYRKKEEENGAEYEEIVTINGEQITLKKYPIFKKLK